MDHYVYIKRTSKGKLVILLLYVDDMLIVSLEEINSLKEQMPKQFAMKDLGAAKQILAIRISRDRRQWKL